MKSTQILFLAVLTLVNCQLSIINCSGQNVGVNTTGSAPDSKHLFEVLQPSTTDNSIGIYVKHSGADATKTLYGLQAIRDGVGLVNIAAYLQAINGTSNYALIVPPGGGNVGIGTVSPLELVYLSGGGLTLSGYEGIGFANESPSNGNVNAHGGGDASRIYSDPNFGGVGFDYLVFEKTDFNFATPDGGIAFTNKGSDNVRDLAMVIAGSGNIGINTTVPASKLEVKDGNISVIQDALSLVGTYAYNSTAASGGHFIGYRARGTAASPTHPLAEDVIATFQGRNAIDGNSASGMTIYAAENQSATALGTYLKFSTTLNTTTSNSERMRITDSGNIGISATSPDGKLQIGSTTVDVSNMILFGKTTAAAQNNMPRIHQYSSDGTENGLAIGAASTSGSIHFYTGNVTAQNSLLGTNVNTERMTITATGNVGIGASPSRLLDVNGEIEWGGNTGVLSNFSPASDVDGLLPGSTAGSQILAQASAHINVSIRANDTNDSFSVTSDSDFNGTQDNVCFFTRADGRTGIGTSAPSTQLHTTGTVRFANFGAGTMQTDASGNISVSSDARLKNIKSDFVRGLDAIQGLTPKTYKWNAISGLDTKEEYTGFIAQNVQQFIPEAVNIDNRGFLTLSDRPIIATLVNATKELNQKIQEQQHIIASLKAENEQKINRTEFENKSLEVDKLKTEISEIKAILNQNSKK